MFPYINWSKCDGCGKCVEICPENVFELKELDQADFKKWHEKLNLIMRGSTRARVINASDCLKHKSLSRVRTNKGYKN